MQNLNSAAPVFGSASVIDPSYSVLLPSGEQSVWAISQNLTDRWGEVNDYESDKKPLLPLIENPELFNVLRNQMWDEITFVVRKDGVFGILFEVEYCTRESEAILRRHNDGYDQFFDSLLSEADRSVELQASMSELSAKYPSVQFCIPPKEEIVEERLAIWGFVADGLLDEEQIEALGRDLLSVR